MKFIFTLSAFAVALSLLSACAQNSGSSTQDPTVSTFAGTPGSFAGSYIGTCVVKTLTRTYTNCSTRILIKQDEHELTVRTTFLLNPSSNRNQGSSNASIKGQSIDHIEIRCTPVCRTLISDKDSSGTLGESGFGYRRAGDDFTFQRIAPIVYDYRGTFQDDSGRSVMVTGRVKRMK